MDRERVEYTEPTLHGSIAAKSDQKSGSNGSQGEAVIIPQCKLRRQRFTNKKAIATKSTVGGGKLFRKSHVRGPEHEIPKVSKVTSTYVAAGHNQSLSDIETISSGGEDQQVEKTEDVTLDKTANQRNARSVSNELKVVTSKVVQQ